MSAFLSFVSGRALFARARLGTLSAVGALVAAAVAAGQGCGTSGGSSGFGDDPSVLDGGATGDAGPLSGLVSLEVTPADVALRAGDTTTSQAFTARGRFADGTARDVTSDVAWSAFPAQLLTAAGPRVTPTGLAGGDGMVSAVSGGITGTTKIHVAFAKTVLAAGAPPGSGSKLGGPPATALAATLLYPLDGALFPPNLAPMEIQWRPAPGTTLFDVHFVASALDLHVITPCNAVLDGCSLTSDAATWGFVVATAQGSGPVAITVRATDDQGTGVGTSSAASVQFAQTGIKGGSTTSTREGRCSTAGPPARASTATTSRRRSTARSSRRGSARDATPCLSMGRRCSRRSARTRAAAAAPCSSPWSTLRPSSSSRRPIRWATATRRPGRPTTNIT